MFLEEWMRRHDGVAHSSQIYAAGFSKRTVAVAVQSGRMLRVRRSWLVLRDCHPDRAAAARVGGRLTCVSAAQALELWVPAHEHVHVAVSPTSARFDAHGLRVHWSNGPAPFAPRAAVDPLINVLFHVARCQPQPDALAIWESALNKGLIGSEALRRVSWRSERAAALAALASHLSDSGLETHFVDLMRAIGVTPRQQVWIDGHPVDTLIGDRLVVQLDGFAYHSDAAARRRDIAADVRLRLLGYTVLRFDYQQVLFNPDFVRDSVLTAIAQGLHLAT
jgi:very-short-patch-repair endonuclease